MRKKTEEIRTNLEYIEHPERTEGFYEIPVPENLQERAEAGMKEAKKRLRQNKIKNMAKAGMGMAAAVAFASVLCVSNPTIAANLPLIGHIFERVEDKVSMKGDFANVAETLQDTEAAAENGQEAQAESTENTAYTKTSNGKTITLSEVYYNKNAMYMTLSIHSDEPFPEDVQWMKNCEDYILDYDLVNLAGTERSSYKNSETGLFGSVEGTYVDEHTFAGMLRIDIGSDQWWPTTEEMQEKGMDVEKLLAEGTDANAEIRKYFPDAGKRIEAPDTFEYDMHIEEIMIQRMDNVDTDDTDMVIKGNWDFHLDVALDTEETQTVEIHDVDEHGIGLEDVVKSRYELTVHMNDQDAQTGRLYCAEVFDANGEKMEYAGSYMNSRQTYGYDTSKINVYICDYDEYMDELKGYYWSEDYEEKAKTKTYEQYIAEHALYHKEISFE